MTTKASEAEVATVNSRSTQSSAQTGAGGLRPGGGGPVDRKFSIMSTTSRKGVGRNRQALSDIDGIRTRATSPQLENSYKLAPDIRFNVKRVEDLVKQILESKLRDATYSSTSVKSMTTDLSEAIKLRVKTLGFPRHKLIIHVIIGPIGGQAVRVASRCVWDDKQDDYASVSYQNPSLFAVASVYGVYFE